ncbi:roadblock/LC7 domain-containing protein [Streptomyces sp. CBMA29]|uniref:roadblock/LC7 domain-containing protein n=1 Tax=Streptomyces sp. CBMA29 TaxID=1896314 RepID=UPI001661BCB9|nr:roadblock/LC7 domain-containing protein [Streptomyces sp. CBMA29]MBD0738295.1 dynein regulation protein LC7 [Streptomyces sp. CBMA29]
MTSAAPYEALVASLKSLRERVMGVNETVISTSDGLLVAADTATVQPESLAALAAASLGVGRRTAAEVGLGGLRDVVVRCNGGYIVVLSVGEHALLVILADEGLDLPGLHRESPATVDHLVSLLSAA